MHSLNREKLLALFGYSRQTRESFQPPQEVFESLEYPDQRIKTLKEISEEVIVRSEQEDTGSYACVLREIISELCDLLTELNKERKSIAADTPDDLMQLVLLKNELAELKLKILSIEGDAELRQLQHTILDEQKAKMQDSVDIIIAYLDLEN